MNKSEVSVLLGRVSALDGQSVDEAKVEMWLRVLGDYSLEECDEAIIPAYRESTGLFLSAKDIWQHVRRIRSQPKPREWVREYHDRDDHCFCVPGDFGHKVELEA